MATATERDYAYSVYVEANELSDSVIKHVSHFTHICRNNQSGLGPKYVTFADATCPLEQREMPAGFERYEAWKAHEKAAREIEWRLINTAFSETRTLGLDSLPLLWVTYPEKMDIGHSERTLEYTV
jgi:hypothetical protein